MKKSITSEYSNLNFRKLRYLENGSFNFKKYTLQEFTVTFKYLSISRRFINYYHNTVTYVLKSLDMSSKTFNCFRLIISYTGDVVVIKNNWKGGDALYCYVKSEDVLKDLGAIINGRYVVKAMNMLRKIVAKTEATKARKRMSKSRYYNKKS